MSNYETWQIALVSSQLVVFFATFLVTVYVGGKANKISERMRQLQDYVAIVAIPWEDSIKLLNAGKVNLYLWGFDVPGNTHRFNKPRLIPSGTNDSAFYYIGAPPAEVFGAIGEFSFKLYLEDEFKNRWITDAGGSIERRIVLQDGKKVEGRVMRVWTYNTYKENWIFDASSTVG